MAGIGWKHEGSHHDADLFELDEFDTIFYGEQLKALKPEEELFRYQTDVTKMFKMRILVKINCARNLIYFLKDSESGEPEFETRGIKAIYVNLPK